MAAVMIGARWPVVALRDAWRARIHLQAFHKAITAADAVLSG